MANHPIGQVKNILRIEGLGILVMCLAAYNYYDYGWGLFFIAFLAPDLAFIGYLAGSKVGAACYNTTHSLIGPALLIAATIFWTLELFG